MVHGVSLLVWYCTQEVAELDSDTAIRESAYVVKGMCNDELMCIL